MATVKLQGNMYKCPVEFIELTEEQLNALYMLGLDVRQTAYMENGYRAYVLFIGDEIKRFAVQKRWC